MSTTLVSPALMSSAHLRAVWQAQSGALMLLGHASSPLPKAGSARMSKPSSATPGSLGLFRAEFWAAAGGGQNFLAVVRLPNKAEPASADLVLRGARASDRDVCIRLLAPSNEAEFGCAIAALAGLHAAKLARFMLELMRPDDGSDTSRVNALFSAFLAAGARRDGCVELILQAPGHCVILQGWGASLPSEVEIVSTTPFPLLRTAHSGEFVRTDVKAPSVGSVLALPAEALDGIGNQDAIYILAGGDLLCRNIVEPRVLDPHASAGQLRHLLPRLDCPPPLAALLRSVLRPRFEGADTLNNAALPVRAALDVAVYADGAGIYLSGWLFDPAGHVAEITICTGQESVRLDDAFVRIARDDVSAAFSADAAFPKPLSNKSGFAVSATLKLSPGTAPYLRFSFLDGDFAFLPVPLSSALPAEARRGLLKTVDLHKPSGVVIVERHLAPFFAGLPAVPCGIMHVSLTAASAAPNAIVVALRNPKLPRTLVASFLREPPSVDERVVFVIGPEWDIPALDALIALLRFYGIPASVLMLPESPNPLSALAAVEATTDCENLLLLAPNVVGTSPCWRAALYEAEPDASLICPTVLYEDRSVRFSGSVGLTVLDHAPFAQLNVRLAGLNTSYVTDVAPSALKGGTLACCLVRRPALAAIDRAFRLLTAPGMEAAFFREAARLGQTGIWLPSVRVVAPEEDESAPPIACLIDGWMLRQEWEERACAS